MYMRTQRIQDAMQSLSIQAWSAYKTEHGSYLKWQYNNKELTFMRHSVSRFGSSCRVLVSNCFLWGISGRGMKPVAGYTQHLLMERMCKRLCANARILLCVCVCVCVCVCGSGRYTIKKYFLFESGDPLVEQMGPMAMPHPLFLHTQSPIASFPGQRRSMASLLMRVTTVMYLHIYFSSHQSRTS